MTPVRMKEHGATNERGATNQPGAMKQHGATTGHAATNEPGAGKGHKTPAHQESATAPKTNVSGNQPTRRRPLRSSSAKSSMKKGMKGQAAAKDSY
jgi:hypothetical protein